MLQVRAVQVWRLGSVVFALAVTCACKTKGSGGAAPQLQSVGGVLTGDDNQKSVRLSVPTELQGFIPEQQVGESGAASSIGGGAGGLNLAGSTGLQTSAGVAMVTTECYNRNSLQIEDNWRFHAALYEDGALISKADWEDVNSCNEMQLNLKTLDKTKTYRLVGAFYWRSNDGQTTIVWYEGSTERFKPSDQTISLVLEKLRMDQVVNVDVERTEKERCIAREFLWNGQRCLDQPHSLVFAHTDKSFYEQKASEEGARDRKCLDIGPQGLAIQKTCNYRTPQQYFLKLHSATDAVGQNFPKEGYSWFQIASRDGRTCLQVVALPSGGDPYLGKTMCDPQIPRQDQIFTLVDSVPGERAARESFRVVSIYDQSVRRCISVPPEEVDPVQGSVLRDGAYVRMTPCGSDRAGTNPYVLTSQYIRFVQQDD